MKIIKCKLCMAFANDVVFQNVRSKLVDKGVNLQTLARLKPELRKHVPLSVDHTFYDDCGFQIVVDARGYEPKHVSCQVNPESVTIKATRKTNIGEMSFRRSYTVANKSWNIDSTNCLMSSDGIVFVNGYWK